MLSVLRHVDAALACDLSGRVSVGQCAIQASLDAALQRAARIRRWNPAPAQNIKVVTIPALIAS